MPQPSNEHPAPARTAVRVSLACVQCRSRHLRCDAATPKCSRCSNTGGQCTYMKSRRGGKPRATPSRPNTRIASPPPPSGRQGSPQPLPIVLTEDLDGVPTIIADPCGSCTSDPSGSSVLDPSGSSTSDPAIGSSSSGTTFDSDSVAGSQHDAAPEPLLDLYYAFFHAAHPCALPLHFMKQKMSENAPGMKVLVLVMRFIGSLYVPSIASGPLEEQVKIALTELRPSACAFEVQALILFSIAVYWLGELQTANEQLEIATRKAIAIGMNTKQFATENSGGDAVLAESWRRTWWLLYLTDAQIASINHVTTFGTSQRCVPATVELPCEEADYNSGNISYPKTLEDYDNREFMDDSTDFSSFAYLIGLARSLDHIIIGIPRTSEENIKAMCANADASIAAWLSLLSKSKRKLFRDDGTVDELLFKANALIQVYTVDIHRALSSLKYIAIEAVSSCAPPPPPERLAPVYYRDAHIHTAKILRAIERITDMITLPTRIAVHSPFTICIIATITIAHLSACKHVLEDEQLKISRERIRVAMGALETFAEVWPKGKKVVREVKTIAKELLSLKAATETGRLAESGRLPDINVSETLDGGDAAADADFFAHMNSPGYFQFPGSGSGFEFGLQNNDLALGSGFPFDVTMERHMDVSA